MTQPSIVVKLRLLCHQAKVQYRFFMLASSVLSLLKIVITQALKGQLSFNWQFNVLACQQSFSPEAPHHAIQLQLISATILIIRR